MTRSDCLRSFSYFRFVILAAALLTLSSGAYGQARPSSTPFPDATTNGREKDDHDPAADYGSPENEIRMKLRLKEEKKRYDENVARAREVSQLATQLRQIYEARKAFNSEDAKRWERLEKLTRRIRNEAGGSDSEADLEPKDVATAMGDVLKKVAEVAEDLEKLVEKTPRQVVSTTVINSANKLIGLVQHIRGEK